MRHPALAASYIPPYTAIPPFTASVPASPLSQSWSSFQSLPPIFRICCPSFVPSIPPVFGIGCCLSLPCFHRVSRFLYSRYQRLKEALTGIPYQLCLPAAPWSPAPLPATSSTQRADDMAVKKQEPGASRPPTAPSDHENALHNTMEDPNIIEGTPPRSMYIDDQAEEDTDAEMDDSEGDYDDEDSMEAQVRRDEESTFVRANLAQAQEQWLKGGPRPRVPTPAAMEVEQEGETLAGSPNSMLASELFPQDEESGSETETEEYLPPPSSKTTVAYVISARIRRYFDEQAEDSDEDAGEEREEEEQEMEEDREFVDDTAVDEDFVHRLPSNKDDAREVEKWVAHFQNEDNIAHYKRDVAREAAGEAGAPSSEQKRMLSPRELIAEFERALHWEMLADVDVEPHTWVRAPDQFDCRVGDGFPKWSLPSRKSRCSRKARLSGLSRVVLAKPSPALDAGDRVVVTTGDRKDSTGIITCVADIRIAGKRVAMAQVLPPAPKPYPKGKGPIAPVKPPKPFEVGLAQLKRHALDLYYHFRIHDRVRVVSGALYVGAIGRVEEVEGDFLTVAIPKDWEVAGATWPSPTSDVTKLFIISIVHVTRQWAIGDSVRVTRGQYEGQAGVILGPPTQVTWSYLLESAADRLKNGVEPPPERHTGKLLKPVDSTRLRNPDVAGIMVTIRGDHSLETVQVPIENYDGVLGQGSFFSPAAILFGGNRLNHPRIHALSPIEAPSAATPKRHHLLPDLQLPSPRMRLYGDHIHRWKERITDDGFASPSSTISKVQRTLEGSCGWVLLSEPVTTKTRKVDVCSVGKNQNMYSIDKRCIKPRRDIDSGKWLVEITERVVIIGPDRESDRARTGQYALTEPSYFHAYGNHVVAVKFVDGAHGFYPMNSLCLSENVEVVLGSHTFPATTFL
ncbi:hypothetical protein B0H14DRAFT_3500819 [Mycena olivaceomarginata]|nr:hypothetical protein B0H14DRAFT_3500819 [Mycena olivaceomarginata]